MDPSSDYERARDAVREVSAPPGLRARIDAERDRTLVRRLVVRRMKLAGALSAAAAILGVGVGLLAGDGDSPSTPPILRAAQLAAGEPAAGAPAVDRAEPDHLAVSVGGIDFPRWRRFGLTATGRRDDVLDGRTATTVFYEDRAGTRLGYTIVDGAPLPWPEGARPVEHRGVAIRLLHRDGRAIAVWRAHGHSCIISAPESVSDDRLVELASSQGYA